MLRQLTEHCPTARGDERYELVDGLLCADRPVRVPVDLTLVAEHRRGHASWCQLLDAVRLGPGDDVAEVTAAQVRRMVTGRYGTALAMVWDHVRPRLTARSAWIDHAGELPVIESTLIHLQADRLPGGNDAQRAPAGVPVRVRPGTHVPHDQADARLDPSQAPYPRSW